MTCPCGKESRIVAVNAKCSDMCTVTFVNQEGMERDGYVPSDMGIGGGDYIQFRYCLDCGRIQRPSGQRQWPLDETTMEAGEEDA